MKESDLPASPEKSQPGPIPAAPARPIQRRHWSFWLAVSLCTLLVLYLIFGRSNPKPAPVPPPVPVSAQPVKLGNIDLFLDALGTVTPVYTVTVTSRVDGELTEVDYREGQMVMKNDLLAVIDPRPYNALLLQAKGQLARDQALLKNARIDLARYQGAFEQHAIPEQQLATQQALVEQDEGIVTLDQGNLAAAQVNVDYTRIVSPIDGRVGLRAVDPGNIVAANGTAALATITQLQPITVIFFVAEDDLSRISAQIAAGRTLRVVAFDRTQQNKLAEGTLIALDNQINPATGTVRARAQFSNERNELFPNQFVNTRLFINTLTQVNLAPSAAIQRNNDAAFVYVVQPDGTIKSRDIKIVATEGEVAAVTNVSPGEELVTDGFDKLQNGTRIAVRQAPAAQAGSGAPPSPAQAAKAE